MNSLATLYLQRHNIMMCAVLIHCLDADQKPIPGAYASGFLRSEQDGRYLYTSWHVVTGYDPYFINEGRELPTRRFLRLAMQDVKTSAPGVEEIGGLREVAVPLYANTEAPLSPVWLQNDQHVPHFALNSIGLYVPFWHDVVKIKMPDDLRISSIQLSNGLADVKASSRPLEVGERCLVVGFPYGFSSLGTAQPTPVALTRYVAAKQVSGRPSQALLESIGAPGMSGGPVFVEREDRMFLAGVYTGMINPAYQERIKDAALGCVADLWLLEAGGGQIRFVRNPSKPEERRP